MVGDHGIPVEILADGRVRLLEDVTFSIQDLCGVRVEIDVPAGFVCDGASIPRMFWSIVGHPMSGGPLRAAIIHDALCAQARTPRARRFADTIFAWVMEEQCVPRWRRLAMFWAVRAYGVCVWRAPQKRIDRPEVQL
jgi:hypothetical protein